MPRIPQPAYRQKTPKGSRTIFRQLPVIVGSILLPFTTRSEKPESHHVTPGESIVHQGFWLRCNIQGYIVKLLIFTDQFEYLMDVNGQPVELPKYRQHGLCTIN